MIGYGGDIEKFLNEMEAIYWEQAGLSEIAEAHAFIIHHAKLFLNQRMEAAYDRLTDGD